MKKINSSLALGYLVWVTINPEELKKPKEQWEQNELKNNFIIDKKLRVYCTFCVSWWFPQKRKVLVN